MIEKKKNYLTLCATSEAFYMLAKDYQREVILTAVRAKYELRAPGITEVVQNLMVAFQMEKEKFGLKSPYDEKTKIERFS